MAAPFERYILSEEQALIPIEERQVDFYGDDIIAVLVDVNGEEHVYIPVRPICTYLGLSWSGQSERIKRDLVLSEEARFVRVTRTNLGGNPNILCLPLDFLNGWLFGINAARVKEEHREKVVRYQRECYRILAEAFQVKSAVTASSFSIQTLEQLRETGLAIAQLAEQQIAIETRLTNRLDKAAQVIGDIQRRLGAVERRVKPAEIISDEQASDIALSVKSLGELLTNQSAQKGKGEKIPNYYQSIFTELYRRFGISKYTLTRQADYRDVMAFLEDWRKSIDKPSRPSLFDEPVGEE
jgi:P22_AR N-terminal domain